MQDYTTTFKNRILKNDSQPKFKYNLMCSSRSSIYTAPWRSRPEQLPQRRRSRRTKIPSISEQSLRFRLCSQAPQIPFAHASLCIITLFVLCTTLKQSDSFPFILFPIAPVGFGFDFSRWSLNIHLDLSAPRGAGHSCVRPRVSMSHLRLPPGVQGRTEELRHQGPWESAVKGPVRPCLACV